MNWIQKYKKYFIKYNTRNKHEYFVIKFYLRNSIINNSKDLEKIKRKSSP